MSEQATTTAPPGELYWRYSVPRNSDSKMWLLTIGNIAVSGNWSGTLGQYYKAWCPLPKRDKDLEAALGLVHPAQSPGKR